MVVNKIYKGGIYMTLYDEFVERVERGARFSVDIKNKTLKVNSTKLINNGEWKGDLINADDVMENLLHLYREYKISTPSERSDKHKHIFKAKSLEELTDAELVCGMSREIAQAKLEGFLLCTILSGDLNYPNEDKWFWKSSEEPSLILLKAWFE